MYHHQPDAPIAVIEIIKKLKLRSPRLKLRYRGLYFGQWHKQTGRHLLETTGTQLTTWGRLTIPVVEQICATLRQRPFAVELSSCEAAAQLHLYSPEWRLSSGRHSSSTASFIDLPTITLASGSGTTAVRIFCIVSRVQWRRFAFYYLSCSRVNSVKFYYERLLFCNKFLLLI